MLYVRNEVVFMTSYQLGVQVLGGSFMHNAFIDKCKNLWVRSNLCIPKCMTHQWFKSLVKSTLHTYHASLTKYLFEDNIVYVHLLSTLFRFHNLYMKVDTHKIPSKLHTTNFVLMFTYDNMATNFYMPSYPS